MDVNNCPFAISTFQYDGFGACTIDLLVSILTLRPEFADYPRVVRLLVHILRGPADHFPV